MVRWLLCGLASTGLAGTLAMETLVLTVENIPSAANKIHVAVDGGPIAGVIFSAAAFSTGSTRFTHTVGVPAGGPYRVRVVAFQSTPGNSFPAILRSGKAAGVTVNEGASVPVTIALSDIPVALDAGSPTSGPAGSSVTLRVNITDEAGVMDGRTTGRIWYSASPFVLNLYGSSAFGVMSQPPTGPRQAAVEIRLPSSPGVLYYQFGESAPDLRNPNGQESPFVIWPNLDQGASLWQLAVTPNNPVELTVNNLPSAANRLVAVVDGGGLTHSILSAKDIAPGSTSVSMTLNVPPGSGYRIRAIAYVSNPAANPRPAILRSGQLTSATIGLGVPIASPLTLSDVTGVVDPATPPKAEAGGAAGIVLRITDPGSTLAAASTGRLWSAATPFSTNLGGTPTLGSWTSAGGNTWLSSVTVSLPGTTGTLYYQFGEAAAEFSLAGETPYLVWPNVESGAGLLQLAVTGTHSLTVSVSNLPAEANRVAVLIDGGASSTKLLSTKTFPAGTSAVTLSFTLPPGGPYRARAIAWTSNGAATPPILRTGKAVNIQVVGLTEAGIALSDVVFTLDNTTPASVFPGAALTIKVNYSDAGDVLEGGNGARIWYASSPFQTNFGGNQVSGWLTSDGTGRWQSETTMMAPAAPGALYYQFGEMATQFATGLETPALVWPDLSRGGSLLALQVITLVNVTLTTSPSGLPVAVDSVAYATPKTFAWVPGSTHRIAALSPQSAGGTRYIWARWSDGGEAEHEVVAPSAAAVFTAVFNVQHLLSLAVSPSGAGTLSASPPSSDGYYNAGVEVQIYATPAPGFYLASFSGDATGSASPANVIMSAPRSVTGTFAPWNTVTISTSPPGLQVVVDGVAYTSPKSFQWAQNSTHTIEASPVQSSGDSRWIFSGWSDGGAAAHAITTAAGGGVYVASYQTQHRLALSVSPPGAGWVSPAPSATDGYYDSGTRVTVTATAATGFVFKEFKGDSSGPVNPMAILVDAPKNITAVFSPLSSVTVATSPAGLPILVDGTPYTTPRTFQWPPGSTHTVSAGGVAASQGRYAFRSWSDGGAATHELTVPATPVTLTANFVLQYQLTVNTSPASAGAISVSPPSPDGYYDAGAQVQVTASPAPAYSLAFFAGALSGSTNPQTLLMDSNKAVTAVFTTAVTANAPPWGEDLSPFQGAGASQSFVATFKDPNGWGDLKSLYLRFHENYAHASGACYLEYRVDTGEFRLMDDAGQNWLGPLRMGSAGVLENGACQLNAAASSIAGDGDTLLLSAALSFKPAFGSAAGREPRKIACLWARDAAGAGEAMSCLGQWIPEAPNPQLIPRYRLYFPSNYAHFFTSSKNERDTLARIGFGIPEDPPPGMVYNQPAVISGVSTQPYYRMIYYPQNGAPEFHFWTPDRAEYKANLRKRTLYFGESMDSYILSGPAPGTYPLYRLQFGGSAPYAIYHYALQEETDALVRMGWGRVLATDGYLQPVSPEILAGLKSAAEGRPRIAAVVDSATLRAGEAAPGELIRVYGSGFSSLARLLVNGRAVALRERNSRYLEFAVPPDTQPGQKLSLEIDDPHGRSEPRRVEVGGPRLSVLTRGLLGSGAAWTATAPPGAVAFHVTGACDAAALTVRIGGYPATVLSVENAEPGLAVVTVKLPAEIAATQPARATLEMECRGVLSQPGVYVTLR